MAETNRAPDGTPAASDGFESAAGPFESDGAPGAGAARSRGEEDVAMTTAAAGGTDGAAGTAAMPRADSAATEPVAPAPSARPEVAEATSTSTVPTAPAEQPVLQPADQHQPAAPKKGSNRLVGTAWVLLAAGLFEVLYFAALGLIVLLLGGPAAVAPQLAIVAGSPFAWLPVVFFLLLFELTVLLFNRAGRFAYVVASLVVGFLVYVISVVLISILVGGGIGDTATLARAFESPEFVLTGLVAREVMLWTGFAIGARGKRVRTRNRAARDAYRQEIAERADAVD